MVEESGDIVNSDDPKYVFASKAFLRWSFGTNIMLMVIISMTTMFMLMAIGINAIVVTVLFIGVMFGVLHVLSGSTTYVLTSKGIEQHIIPNYKKFKPIDRNFTWLEIDSYVRGTDRSRGGAEYNYLNIDVSKSPGKLRLTDDKWDKFAFEAFANAFEQYVGETEKNVSDLSTQQTQTVQPIIETKPLAKKPESAVHRIVKKRTFYEKPIAKVITILFVVLCAALMYFNSIYGMSGFNFYRLNYVVLPGTAYLVFRVFFKGR